ncbi:MAG: phospho-N-acetylmuramoyl-pentapeptide-transferase [Clostridiales bacterium]|nr:phospho-N-acetylmuramoyl-pentapeptide-transferase [Clostridiales bacterium]
MQILLSYICGTVVALIISPIIFKILRRMKTGQNILEYVDNHMQKQGTLSMGGLIFIVAVFISFAFFVNSSMLASLVIIITASYGLLGFLDDYLKVKGKHNEGLKPYQKIIGQVGIASIVGVFIYNFGMLGGGVNIPYFDISINIAFWIIPFVIIFFIAVTNSVNLTDGLDGLAGSVSLIVVITLAVVAYVKYITFGQASGVTGLNEEYLNIAILCMCMAGAISVFLLFNRFPAKIFMGDTGSLALGGFIASVSAFLQEYLLILVIGIVFVLSAVSDIIQVGYYKMTKRRVFLMAPFHHHLERKGMHENRVVGLYIFITLFLCIITILIYLQRL